MDSAPRRTRWVVGNWKQHKLRAQSAALATAITEGLRDALGESDLRVGVAPTFVSLDVVRPLARPAHRLWLFAQNVAAQESGAFTGEVGPGMLQDVGAHGAILGHSERRAHFHETDTEIARKLRPALTSGLTVILCVGEPLSVRVAGDHESHVISQLSTAFQNVSRELIDEHLLIAYEPVWAIGTGQTATPAEASAMHRTIRAWLGERFGPAGTDRSILYGGSVNPTKAPGLLGADIDGFLVGGASLDATSFLDIVRIVARA